MLVVFPPIFVADTKLIYDDHFVAPLKKLNISKNILKQNFFYLNFYFYFRQKITTQMLQSKNMQKFFIE